MKHKKQLLSCTILVFSQLHYATILSVDKGAQQIHRYMWANYKHAGGNLEEAKKWYHEIFEGNNEPIYVYKGYIHLLKDTGQLQEIVYLIPKLESNKAINDDPALQLVFIQALEKTGNQEEAINKIIKANDQHKEHQELAFFTATLYLKRKEPKNALIVIDNFLQNCQRKPNNFIFYFLKAQILVTLGEKEKSREQVKQCIEMHPSFDKGWLFYAMLEEELGNVHEAIKAFTTYLELAGGNKSIEQHLLKLIFKQKINKDNANTISIDATTIKKALSLFEQKQYQEAIDQLQHYLEDSIPKASLTIPRSLLKNSDNEILSMELSLQPYEQYKPYMAEAMRTALEQSILVPIVSPPSFLAY